MFNFFGSSTKGQQQSPVEIPQAPLNLQQNSIPSQMMPEMQQNIQQDLAMPMPMQQCCGCPRGGPRGSGTVTEIILDQKNNENEIVGMVVTMCSGSTYDGVFKSVEQKAGEGERVAVYSCSDLHPTKLLECLQRGTQENECLQKMIGEMKNLEPCTIVFNWECCSGFSGDTFKNDDQNKATIVLMAYLLEKGYMVQCSDFSAGALIKCWDENYLGNNPFIKAGTFSDSVQLKFDSEFLKQNEDSAQLQMVGDLCKDGATLHAMGGTVAFTVDEKKKPSKWKEVETLTVAVRLGGESASSFGKALCHTKSGLKGLAGHVIVRYPSGGRLLVGCPHWIELSNVNVSEDQLLKVAEKRYGKDYRANMETALFSAAPSSAARSKMCQDFGSNFIKQSAPQKYKASSKFYG